MKKSILISFLLVAMINVSGQNPYLELSFTAVDNTSYVHLDSIKIMNRTQNCDTVLYSPDTLLLLGSGFGTEEYDRSKNSLQVFQNYPNPVFDNTTIPVYIPDKDEVKIIVTDVLGRVVVKTEMELGKGMHSFMYAPGTNGMLFFTTQWRDEINSISILSTGKQTTGVGSVEHIGSETISLYKKTFGATQNFTFSFGDKLLYIGYIDTLQSVILDGPATHAFYTFQFATNIPCPGTSNVEYVGQVYNTIQILNQCWMRENLNYATGYSWCYDDDSVNCNTYGRLYYWETIMNGEASSNSVPSGVQGICPNGWHVPSDEEWKILEGTVDTQYGVGSYEWDPFGYRGFDAGKRLKTETGWNDNGNGTNDYNFSALPGGSYNSIVYFTSLGGGAYFWTSSGGAALYRTLYKHHDDIYRINTSSHGLSLRCVKD